MSAGLVVVGLFGGLAGAYGGVFGRLAEAAVAVWVLAGVLLAVVSLVRLLGGVR